MLVVKEEWVLSVKLDLALILRLPSHVVEVPRLEIVLILLLIVRHVASARDSTKYRWYWSL
jgi:hypothetical protein